MPQNCNHTTSNGKGERNVRDSLKLDSSVPGTKAYKSTQYRAAISILERTNERNSPGLKRLARTEFCLARALWQVGEAAEGAEVRRAALKHLQESITLSSESLPESFNLETLEGVDLLVPFVDRQKLDYTISNYLWVATKYIVS